MKANQSLPSGSPLTGRALSVVFLVCAMVLGAIGMAPFTTLRARAEHIGLQPTPAVAPEARMQPGRPGRPLRVAASPLLQATTTPTWTQEQTLVFLESQLNSAWNAQDWALALNLINQIIVINASYDDIQARRYYAHINYGYQFLANGKCTEAKAQFTDAALLRPTGEEAQTALSLLPTYCPTTPATPTITVTPGPTAQMSPTPTAQTLAKTITYTIQSGDTLYSIAKRYGTTVQIIMQANGMMAPVLHPGTVIYVPPAGTPAVGPIVHIVQPGETLRSIAELYRTTVWAIMAANGMTYPTIYAYQAIFVPSPMEHGPTVHMVIPGETLYSIAKVYSTTVPLIMLANNLQTYSLHVYQLLVIPPKGWSGGPLPFPVPWADGPKRPGAPSGHYEGPREGHLYVVQRHDTLFSIARRFGSSVEAIRAANGLSGTTIYVGQRLRIP